MKIFIIMLGIVILGACSSMVTMDTPTTQVFDLNDTDRDGVIVARDLCPSTIIGASIDNNGCGKITAIYERSELKILFANDSDIIEPMYLDQVAAIATFMDQFPDTKVTIEGHCSKTGSYDHNLTLSQHRAEAVTTALNEEFGIATDRLIAIGYGWNNPVNPEENELAYTQNRRVIAEVTGEDSMPELKWHIYIIDEVDVSFEEDYEDGYEDYEEGYEEDVVVGESEAIEAGVN